MSSLLLLFCSVVFLFCSLLLLFCCLLVLFSSVFFCSCSVLLTCVVFLFCSLNSSKKRKEKKRKAVRKEMVFFFSWRIQWCCSKKRKEKKRKAVRKEMVFFFSWRIQRNGAEEFKEKKRKEKKKTAEQLLLFYPSNATRKHQNKRYRRTSSISVQRPQQTIGTTNSCFFFCWDNSLFMRTKLAKKRHIFAKKARNCCSVSKKVNTQRKQKYYKEFRLSNIMVMYWIANLVMMVQVRP